MKNKWIYLEPFVFIWQDKGFYLFYNSMNGKKSIIKKNSIINPIIQSLLIDKNLYCVQLKNGIEEKKDFIDFANKLNTNQLGNIVACYDFERPVNIPPKLILNKSVENSIKVNKEYFDPLPLENITEMTIQVSGICNLDCKFCDEYHLQLTHCKKSNHYLSQDKIENIIQQIKHLNLKKINITGGNITSSIYFKYIVDVFNTANVMKIYNLHLKHVTYEGVQYILNEDTTALVRISVHFDTINEAEIIDLIKNFDIYNSRILWSFVVSSEKELNFCYSILDNCGSINNEIKPFYNKDNELFIRDFVFIEKEDIEDIFLNKKQIFANQVLNRNYFGIIEIKADGKIYDNNNSDSVGSIDDYLEDVVNKIVQDGKSWRCIRSNDICNNCLYRYICPPPSNLELVMKSKTVCQVPRSYETVL